MRSALKAIKLEGGETMSVFELQQKLFELFDKKQYTEAIEIANIIENTNSDMKSKTYLWRACLYCALEQPASAITQLTVGLNEGVWWNPNTLKNDSDLKPLQDLEEFKKIVTTCEAILKEAASSSKPEYLMIKPQHNTLKSTPLIYSLHWRGDNIKRFSQYWDSGEASDNYIFAFPQSSQIYGYNEYCWDDKEIAESDILNTLDQITDDEGLENNDVIIAGASQGGKLALDLALKGSIPNLKGFILVVPAIREIQEYEELFNQAREKGLKGYIITGDKDYFYAGVSKLHEHLLKSNFPCELYVKKGMGHFFPEDFNSILPTAISYILEPR